MDEAPHRKRMKRHELPGGVRFVTFSTQRRLPLLSNPRICDLFAQRLEHTRRAFAFRLYAWVVMPEHVHLLLMPGEAPLDRGLLALKLSVAKRVISRWQELNASILAEIRTNDGSPRFWQKGGGHDRNVRDRAEFSRKVQYIHRNPVERGLVERPDQWDWSSIHWWSGLRTGAVTCDPPPGDPEQWASWKGYQ